MLVKTKLMLNKTTVVIIKYSEKRKNPKIKNTVELIKANLFRNDL